MKKWDMFWKESVPISDQGYNASKPIVFINRILGLFPLVVFKKGTQRYLKWSLFYIIYSYALGIMLVTFTYHGLIKDIMSNKETSVKVKSHTDMYVVICDISVLQLAMFFGIFVNTFNASNFFKFLKCINEVDSIIPSSDMNKARNASIFMITLILTATTCITVADLCLYFRLASATICKSDILERYLAFYASYYVMLMNQYKFWYLGYSILRRLMLLNDHLEIDNFKKECSGGVINNSYFTVPGKVSEINLKSKNIATVVNTLNINARDIPVLSKINYVNNTTKPTHTDCVYKLMTVYATLCDTVEILNSLYGLNNAVIIVGILWHTIETPYLLILEITEKRKDPMYISVMAAWCILHVIRLMLLAQPCYSCLLQVQKTKDLVCRLLLSTDISPPFKSQLKDFTLLLLHRKFEFTAGGLTTIDRSLVTSILGAITTYLVILLQFARSEQT